ncbi:nucleotidyltransferase domain-containing protein [Pseudalkalibacillus berkeleyi]|uniref:Nucleotidyltransferase n=1 Tax=Pseudalkalibacillus berkeleyi TaxID=1069813 RepID=A0ABS9H252_9BACL|nr:nucleotidyltransferase domain-containing protein [Pseudalkalibacillus berkeleyi]MCF6137725.1 nucleotidyltransferase [Pseudalkalibacillus berkeleyi]
MTQIKDIGFTCITNEQGIIVNESNLNKIGSNFRDAVNSILESLLACLSTKIHSVYLRGSLPRGLGIEGVSDIDILVITLSTLEKQERHNLKVIEEQAEQNFSFINGVETGVYSLEEVSDTNSFSIVSFMIKTYSVCLYGENLGLVLPNYKPDDKLANEHIVNLRSQILQAKDDLIGNDDQEDIQDCCTWIMKIIVRCGLAFVIMKENTYTRDLYPAYKLFSKHYPTKQEEMKIALNYAINPSLNNEELLSYLNSFGDWMIQESEEWLKVNNPQNIKHLPL